MELSEWELEMMKDIFGDDFDDIVTSEGIDTGEEKQVFKNPPDSCNICNRDMSGVTVFVDGRTRMGPWADMCFSCHRVHGVGLGVGKGQKYKKQADGRWLKVTR